MKMMGFSVILLCATLLNTRSAHAQIDDQKKACAGGEKAAIDAAVQATKDGLQKTITALKSNATVDQDRYIKWFGAGTPADIKAVISTYETMLPLSIISAYWCPKVNNLAFAWDVGDFAAVDPAAPGAMFFAPDFFTKPLTGANTQAGTVVHELAHQAGAKLRPEVRGPSAVKSLAKTNPANASRNADNYKYYVEDLLWGVP